VERTLIIVKPEGVQRGLIGEVIARFEHKGLKVVGLKLMQIPRETAEKHYAEHVGKPFYEGLVAHITSSPVVVGVLEGPDAVSVARTMMGVTNPRQAAPGTIRGDHGLDIGFNIIHGSDGQEAAQREISIFFAPAELVSYDRAADRWVAGA
jgi:nucleoside-diphosphate kinase